MAKLMWSLVACVVAVVVCVIEAGPSPEHQSILGSLHGHDVFQKVPKSSRRAVSDESSTFPVMRSTTRAHFEIDCKIPDACIRGLINVDNSVRVIGRGKSASTLRIVGSPELFSNLPFELSRLGISGVRALPLEAFVHSSVRVATAAHREALEKRDEAPEVCVRMSLVRGLKKPPTFEDLFGSSLSASSFSGSTVEIASKRAVKVCGSADDVDAAVLAAVGSGLVVSVEETKVVTTRNHASSSILAPASGADKNLRTAGLTGSGQIVGCADSGVDVPACFFQDDSNNVGSSHRKIIGYEVVSGASVGDDESGHGTHVVGTIAGSAPATATAVGYEYLRGVAYEAKVHFTDIGTSTTTLTVPTDLSDGILQAAYDAGARIHSNSWGASTSLYTSMDEDLDLFTYENPDFLVTVAAGNDGSGSGTVGSPAIFKNGIAVGASISTDVGVTMTVSNEFVVHLTASSIDDTESRSSSNLFAFGIQSFGSLGVNSSAFSKMLLTEFNSGSTVELSTASTSALDALGSADNVLVRLNLSEEATYDTESDLIAILDIVTSYAGVGGVLFTHEGSLSNNVAIESTLQTLTDYSVLNGKLFFVGQMRDNDSTGYTTFNDLYETIATDGGSVTVQRSSSVYSTINVVDGVRDFSSRGPTADGRICPTLLAVGSRVISAAALSKGRDFDAAADTCKGDSDWVMMSGTSMATPAVSGGLALLREHFANSGFGAQVATLPTAATLKATLVNSCRATGTASIPNNVEGWGLADISNVVEPEAGISFALATGVKVSQDDAHIYCFTIATPADFRLKATLVWSDRPGSSASSGGQLINDLDLALVKSDGSFTLLGNGWSSAGNAVRDNSNTVEEIDVLAGDFTGTAGEYMLVVRGADILPTDGGSPIDEQAYSLAITGDSATMSSLGVSGGVVSQNACAGVTATSSCPSGCEDNSTGTCLAGGWCECKDGWTGISCDLGPVIVAAADPDSLSVTSAMVGGVPSQTQVFEVTFTSGFNSLKITVNDDNGNDMDLFVGVSGTQPGPGNDFTISNQACNDCDLCPDTEGCSDSPTVSVSKSEMGVDDDKELTVAVGAYLYCCSETSYSITVVPFNSKTTDTEESSISNGAIAGIAVAAAVAGGAGAYAFKKKKSGQSSDSYSSGQKNLEEVK